MCILAEGLRLGQDTIAEGLGLHNRGGQHRGQN
jgi:hypothetical protein